MYTVDPDKLYVLTVLALLISQIDMSALNLRMKTDKNSHLFSRKAPSGIKTRSQQRRLYRRDSWVDTKLNCFTWSAWTNDHRPSPTDEEKIPYTSLDKFCDPMYAGEVKDVQCREDNTLTYSQNKTSSDGKYFVECNKEEVFAKCSILDASLAKCPDLSLRYYCYCDPVLAGVTVSPTVTLSTKLSFSEQTSPSVKTIVTQRTNTAISTVTPSSTQVRSSTHTSITKTGSVQSNGNIVPIASESTTHTYITRTGSVQSNGNIVPIASESTTHTYITRTGSVQSNGNIAPIASDASSKTSISGYTPMPVVSKASVTKFASTKTPSHGTTTTQGNVFQFSSPKSAAGTNTASRKEKDGFSVAGVYITWWIVVISSSFLFCVFNAFLTICLFRRARKKANAKKKKVHKWHDSIAPYDI